MAKKLNQQDLLKLSSINTPPTDSVAFAAKSDGLYQKIGQEENKIATTKELSDKVKTDVPEGAKFTDTNTTYSASTGLTLANTVFSVDFGEVAKANHTHTFASLTSRPSTLKGYGLTEIETNLRTTTSGLTVLGVDAALNLTGDGGQGSTAFGYKAAESAVESEWFTAIGRNAGQSNVSGHRWSAFGQNAGQNNISGSDWLAFGSNAGRYNTTGERWTAIGTGSGYSNTTGDGWTAIGSDSGKFNTTGYGWTAIGATAGGSNTTGITWTAIGGQAGKYNTSGAGWTAIGFDAARDNLTGNAWTAIGNNAGQHALGSFWTAIGTQAGRYNTADESVSIGFKTAENLANGTSQATSFANSVHIGSRAKVSANGVTNEIAIGYNVIGKGSNTVVIGNDDITKTYLNGEVHASIAASMITESTTKKFVTEEQIDEWDAKETTAGAISKANQVLEDAKAYTDDEVVIISNRLTEIDEAASSSLNDLNSRLKTDVPEGAKFTDTNTTYSASTGLTLANNVFSVDFGEVAKANHVVNNTTDQNNIQGNKKFTGNITTKNLIIKTHEHTGVISTQNITAPRSYTLPDYDGLLITRENLPTGGNGITNYNTLHDIFDLGGEITSNVNFYDNTNTYLIRNFGVDMSLFKISETNTSCPIVKLSRHNSGFNADSPFFVASDDYLGVISASAYKDSEYNNTPNGSGDNHELASSGAIIFQATEDITSEAQGTSVHINATANGSDESHNVATFSGEGGGRVGIGTKYPTETLDVNGNVKVSGHFGMTSYSEKLITTTGAINLNLGNVFHRNATANTTFSITNAKAGAHSFTLIITMGATVRTLTFPASVKWQDGEVPEMTEANKTYILTFMTINSGATWFGMEGGSF